VIPAIIPKINVVLFQPEIPQNTGNIARTCAAVGARLHLIRPLGFFLRDKHLKRAGLDYWDRVDIVHHDSLDGFFEACPGGKFAFITKFGRKRYDEIPLEEEVYLVFGRETEGLPPELLMANEDRCFSIPMKGDIRSLNLANAVAVVVFETLRRADFPGL
jgi:tRNA (cytidine/uridine-2'-O-)-methyltransferase